MKNIFRFMSKSKLTILGILLLLIFQAYCDLALPSYTSDIINVGLQQGGIEDGVLEQVSAESLMVLEMYAEDASIIEDSYEAANEDGVRFLKDDVNKEELKDALLMPEVISYQINLLLEQGKSMEEIMAMANDSSSDMNMKDVPDVYLNQIAVSYVSKEYEKLGLDMEEIRNDYLWKVGGIMLLMSLGMCIASVFTGLLASITSAKIGRNLRESLYSKVMAFTNKEMENFSTASLITRSTNDIQQIQQVTVILLRLVAYAPILAIGGIIKVIDTKSGMSWIIVMAVVILAALVGILMAVAMPKFKQMQSLIDRLNLVSREFLTGVMPIRAFSREKHEEERFEVANQNLYKTQLFTNRTMTFMMPLMMFIMNGISVLIVWVGAHKVDAGNIQVGDLTAFITYSMVIVMGFLLLSMVAIMLPRAGVAADRIAEVIDSEITLQDPENPRDDELGKPNGVLCFNEVGFRYPGAEEEAISGISFEAKPGQTTAIIGSTGSGKSTLIHLIPRFFDVSEGSITLDGIDIRQITQHKLRETIGYVPQKGMLFSGTIDSNLGYGGDHITKEAKKEAAEIAQAMEFIDSKKHGMDSKIAQEGSNVSGGQRQRLSIARAIAKHPKIFLFDDSFSALDFKTDLALRSALQDKIKDATVILVAQRISTILHADQIIVLDDGKMVGKGTHEELLASCETYQEIASSQLSEAELAASKKGGKQ